MEFKYGNKIKGKNFRIEIQYLKGKKNEKSFIVHSRRLIDRKKREITTATVFYSVETFVLLNDMITHILEHPAMANKELLRELDQIRNSKYKGQTNLT